MKITKILIFTLFALLFSAVDMPAQSLPAMASDPGIMTGSAPNGMKYYIASNPSYKGRMEVALVQRMADSAAVPVHEMLPHIGNVGAFMKRHAFSMGPEGFVSRMNGATVYRYRDIPVRNVTTTLDSTLLYLVDLSCARVGDSVIPSEDQAVVVVGDVDAKDVAHRLCMLSYMSGAGKSVSEWKYIWDAEKPTLYQESAVSKDGLTSISASFRSERMSEKDMKTILPAVYEKFSEQLGQVASYRLAIAFADKDIPVADVSYRCLSSIDTGSDEQLSVNVTLRQRDSLPGLEVLRSVLASLERDGVSRDEMRLSGFRFDSRLRSSAASAFKSNSAIADRCIRAYLYGIPTASAKEKYALHTSRNVPDSTMRRLLNSFVAALVDIDDTTSVKALSINMSDTLSFPQPLEKVKVKTARKEYLSGGTMWEFANGMKVIYKKMDTGGALHWALALNGGYGSIRGLSAGEGAFMSDCLEYSYVNGIRGRAFRNILNSAGVTIDAKVNISNVIFSGQAPEDRMDFLFKSLLALSGGINADKKMLDYYAECQDLAVRNGKDAPYGHRAVIDSLMCPDNRLTGFKMAGRITDGYLQRSDAFFADLFSRMNDGVIVLVGSMEDYQVKKVLQNHIGGFRTSRRVVSKEPMNYQLLSGCTTHVVDADRNGILTAMSIEMPLTIDTYMTTSLAAMLLKQKVAEVLSDAGMYMTLSSNVRIYPHERASVMMAVRGGDDPVEGITVLRSVLSDVSARKWTDADLKLCKADLKNAVAMKMKTPEYWTEVLIMRYLYGKDLGTGYAARIDAVTAENVCRVLQAWNSGSKVEYIMKKR